MKKVTLLRIAGCILFLSLVLYPSNPSVHLAEGSIFNGLFTEPCEVSYVIFYDGYILKFTSYEEMRVDMLYATLKVIVEKRGRKIKDIAIKIHNHLPGGGYNFSDGDLRFMRAMRQDGFKGSYCLKLPTGKIKYKRDENAILIQFLKRNEVKDFLKEYKKKYPKAYKELTRFIKERTSG